MYNKISIGLIDYYAFRDFNFSCRRPDSYRDFACRLFYKRIRLSLKSINKKGNHYDCLFYQLCWFNIIGLFFS